MGDMSKEPSMEDILSSIRRVIEREDAGRDAAGGHADDTGFDQEPLELTEISHDPAPGRAEAPAPGDKGRIAAHAGEDDAIVSLGAADASRAQLASLERLSGGAPAPAPAQASTPTTIDDMVRESLRPMLKAWLDQNLPALVERIVQREIERITRK